MKKLTENRYNPAAIEPKWQSKWEKEKIYHPDLDSAKRPFYNLMMFPYPSAEGLHIGGTRTFAGVDIFARFKRMNGYDVFQPFGLDGFGIHAENYALKIGKNPMDHADITEENFYRQIRESAIGVDWDRTVETYKKDYYKWTQWLFAELFKKGLAYRKKSPVNFCPSCKTVLADEQVLQRIKKQEARIKDRDKEVEIAVGVCERCETPVEKKNLEQWFFRITKYADRLLNNIDGLDWTEKVKIAQRNWIGKKDGISIKYKVLGSDYEVDVFTTRPDTNFGASFIALAPENPLVEEILRSAQDDKASEIKKYIKEVKNKTEIDRLAEKREKTGVFTGLYALNPLTNYKMPIWISDFVLMGFGTGAVVGVPGHDTRDFEFAKKFGLEIIRVVVGKDGDTSEISKLEQVQEEEGTMINSDFLNGMDIHKATEKIMDYVEEKGYGRREATYHLRDWLISRQRYWGPPIPMIYCATCEKTGKGEREEMPGWYAVEEKDLPVELPYIEDFKPFDSAQGDATIAKGPLANHPEFYKVACPECGAAARRETDVSDTFLDSSWYFLRYLATDWDNLPFPSVKLARSKKQEAIHLTGSGQESKEEIENWKLKIENSAQRAAWLPVTMYIGGAEHSVLHLLYARFITMFLKDQGLISFEEPFSKFYAHGLIIKDGAKMSKSKGNVVGPDLYIKKYGADTLRMYLHFLAPFSQEGDFKDEGIDGMHRFLKKVWHLFAESRIKNQESRLSTEGLRMMHGTIKAVTEEMEALRFNTAIAHLMTWYNFLAKQETVSLKEAENYLKLLAPFAPHMAEELYQNVILSSSEGSSRDSSAKPQNDKLESIHTQPWPEFDEKYLVADTVTIPVQVNGKLRGTIEIKTTEAENKEKIEAEARKDGKVASFLDGKSVKKFIYIPGKVANFVV